MDGYIVSAILLALAVLSQWLVQRFIYMGRAEHRKHDEELERLRRLEPSSRIPTAVKYFRTIGFSAFLLGAGALVFGIRYWWGVVLIYATLGAALLDIWFEPDLRGTWKRVICSFVVLLAAAFFNFGIVFLPAPLEVRTYSHLGNYGTGAQIAGKEWKPEWIDLRVRISNPTDYDYSDLDLWIIPDLYLVEIWQKSGVPNVSFLDFVQVDIQQTPVKPPGPTKESEGNITNGAPKRVLVPVLPKHSELELVMALKNLVPAPEKPSASITVMMDGPKNFPAWVKVAGEYKLMGHPHEITRTYNPQQFP